MQVGVVVPQRDDVLLALEAELADRRGAEREVARVGGVELDPAGADDAQDVAVAEERGVAAAREGSGDHAVCAVADLVRGLTVGDAVAPEVPARPLLADLTGGEALVAAVVVLAQVRLDLRA